MRTLIFLLTICLITWLGSGTPINPSRSLTNRPKIDEFGPRNKRIAQSGVKTLRGGFKGPLPRRLDRQLRKGEYVCGNRICKLKPGVIPKGCDEMCQYPIH